MFSFNAECPAYSQVMFMQWWKSVRTGISSVAQDIPYYYLSLRVNIIITQFCQKTSD